MCRSAFCQLGCLLLFFTSARGILGGQAPEPPSWKEDIALALDLERRGDLIGAERAFRSALAHGQRAGYEATATAHVLDALGLFYDDIGDFDQAIICFKSSLAIWRRTLPPGHVALARVVNRLAAAYLESGQAGKVAALDLPAWVARLEANDPSSKDLIPLLENLAVLKMLEKRFDEAESLYWRTLQLVQGCLSCQPGERAVVLNDLGLLYLRWKRGEKAVAPLFESLDLWNKVLGPDNPNSAITGHSLALAYMCTGNFTAAAPLLLRSISLAEKHFGPNSLRTAEISQSYAVLLRKIGKKAEAKTIEQRIRPIVLAAQPHTSSLQSVDITELLRKENH